MPNLITRTFQRATSFAVDWNNIDGSAGSVGGGVDAVGQTQKRRNPSGKVRHLDDEVKDKTRKGITLSARNVTRNFETAAWAIRKHLDFVSRFTFNAKTGNDSFDKEIESFVRWWGRPENFDVTGRHSLLKTIRMAEGSRCIDGDIFALKISSGRIQMIEGDRVITPTDPKLKFNDDLIFNGVETTVSGRPKRYALHARKRNGGLEFSRWVPRRNLFVHGFFDRFDQQRGLSPLVASLNRFQDVYENFDYALARSKVAQLFGLVITRDAVENGFGTVTGTDTDADGVDDKFDVKLGTRPMVLDLDPGEGAEFLENKTPAVEFQQFTDTMIAVALKSLDIPISFFDETKGNFYGNKSAVTLYLQSARDKRDDVQELLRKLTIWRLRLAIEDGDVVLPRTITSMEDIAFEWIPAGIPWFDPRDVRGDVDAIKAGLKTREQVRRDRFGDSWMEDVVPVLEAEQRVIEERGLRLTMEAPPIQVVSTEELELETESR